MEENTKLLNYIYQNSQMGVITITQLLDIVESDELKETLKNQLNEYEQVNKTALKKLNDYGFDEKGINAFEKLRTNLMINIQTLMDNSTSHIAEMMMIGSNMGVINAIKNIKKFPDAEEDIKNLMNKLLQIEEDNIRQLKQFLG